MNNEQIKLLTRMKNAIKLGNCDFHDRKDRNIKHDLVDIDIDENDAWKEMSILNANFFVIEYKPIYKQSNNSLTFKKIINGKNVYIKLVLEIDSNGNDFVYCWSFHIDGG